MLKGLKGILEKGLQIAAPIIGGSMFGAPGAMFGSGIASLLSGDKPKDALIKAGLSGIAGYRGADNISMIDRVRNPLQVVCLLKSLIVLTQIRGIKGRSEILSNA